MGRRVRKSTAFVEAGLESFREGGLLHKVPMNERQREIVRGLVDGNRRYVEERTVRRPLNAEQRKELAKGQHPDAVIHSCGDSRVNPNELFDQQTGKLFIGRVAGNVVDGREIGNIEYAAEHLDTPVIVVLGHTGCGAVIAACSDHDHGVNIGKIVSRVRPAVSEVMDGLESRGLARIAEEHLTEIVETNVRNSMAAINSSAKIKWLVDQGKVVVLGAVYSLETGEVRFLA